MSVMRLDKFLAQAGWGTRTEVKKIIRTGAVMVNDTVEKDGDRKINPDTDKITCCGKVLSYAQFHYIMLSKPSGCVTAVKDNLHKTVMDYLPEGLHRNLAPVGRLDLDTEGLLLITDNGDLAHRLLSPAHHVPKTYYAKIAGVVLPEHIKQFAEGLDIGEGKPTRPAVLEILKSEEETAEIRVTISEGRFHQVKRMFHAIGTEVIYLKRLSMGDLKLDDTLHPGEWRYLTKEEEECLLSC